MRDRPYISSNTIILILHDHHQGLQLEPVLLLIDVNYKRHISQCGYYFKGFEKKNTMICEIDHISAQTPSSCPALLPAPDTWSVTQSIVLISFKMKPILT